MPDFIGGGDLWQQKHRSHCDGPHHDEAFFIAGPLEEKIGHKLTLLVLDHVRIFDALERGLGSSLPRAAAF
jgi:hypothetical protein